MLEKWPLLFSSASSSSDADKFLPWTYQIFVFFTLLHSENLENCERGATGLANLYEIMRNSADLNLHAHRLKLILKSAKEHLQVSTTISKIFFIRYR